MAAAVAAWRYCAVQTSMASPRRSAAAAWPIAPCPRRDVPVHEGAFEIGMHRFKRIAVGIRELAPAVEMRRHMQGLAAIADIVGPFPQVRQDQGFAAFQVPFHPGLVVCVLLHGDGRRLDPPIGEVLGQLLPAVDDGVGQIADPVAGGCRAERLGKVPFRTRPDWAAARSAPAPARSDRCASTGRRCTLPLSSTVVKWAGLRVESWMSLPEPFQRSGSRASSPTASMDSSVCRKAGMSAGKVATPRRPIKRWPVAPQAWACVEALNSSKRPSRFHSPLRHRQNRASASILDIQDLLPPATDPGPNLLGSRRGRSRPRAPCGYRRPVRHRRD